MGAILSFTKVTGEQLDQLIAAVGVRRPPGTAT